MRAATAKVLKADGSVAGASFLIHEDLVVTCAHVVEAVGQGPDGQVRLVFPHLPNQPERTGLVLADRWRASEAEDIAVVRLESVLPGAVPLPMRSARGRQGNDVFSFGFPSQAIADGHYGYAKAGDVTHSEGMGDLLQLSDGNGLTTGFSGGPVVDEHTGLVIAMVNSITPTDAHARGQNMAYGTPTDELRKLCPELVWTQVPPYRGLESFDAKHAKLFKGRDSAVRSVTAALEQHPRALLLLGPSGAGKSSLINAGVLPALVKGRIPGSAQWSHVVARPNQDLLTALEDAGLPGAATDGILPAVKRRLADDRGCARLVLVIDQFEELLTQQPTPAEGAPASDRRLAVASQLVELIRSRVPVSLILIMRNDFYAPLEALAPDLMNTVLPGLVNVPRTLTAEELEEIITGPAEEVGIGVESGLADLIVRDIIHTAGTANDQVPVTLLPPLELALSQLCDKLDDHDGRLTRQGYRNLGTVTGALKNWCNRAIDELENDAQGAMAQRILTALVRPADDANGIPATRRQVPLTRLRALAAAPKPEEPAPETSSAEAPPTVPAAEEPAPEADFDKVLAALTSHRMITIGTMSQPGQSRGEPAAELIHDALIRDWGELRDWVDEDRQFQVWLDRATEQAKLHGQKQLPGDLLDGSLLSEGLEWDRKRSLPQDVAALLTASDQHQNAALRRTRRFNTILAGALALALIAAGVAFVSRQDAITAQHEAEARQLAAESRQIALESSNMRDLDPDLASLLAVKAYRMSPTAEAKGALYAAADLPLRDILPEFDGDDDLAQVAFSPDGKTLATGSSSGTVRLWDAASSKLRATFKTYDGTELAMAFSQDGKTLATVNSGASDKMVKLWDLTSGKSRTTWILPEEYGTSSVAFSPDGKTVAISGDDSKVRLRDVSSGKARRTLDHRTGEAFSLAFSPDGKTIAAQIVNSSVDADNTTRLWDVNSGTPLARKSSFADSTTPLAFSPDGKSLATGGAYDTLKLWNADTGKSLGTANGYTAAVESIAFSPDGNTIATGHRDGSVRLLDLVTGNFRATLKGHTTEVSSLAFSRDGKILATSSTFGDVRLWNATNRNSRSVLHDGSELDSVRFSPDGRTLATYGDWASVQLWKVLSGKEEHHPLGDPHDFSTTNWYSIAFSPDGRSLATGQSDGALWLWDMNDDSAGHGLNDTRGLDSLLFSPDSRTLATSGGTDGFARLWDTASGTLRATLEGDDYEVDSMAFSPDSKTFATIDNDGVPRLWDVPSGKARRTLRDVNGNALVYDPQHWVAFSPDGETLVSGSTDGFVQVSDVASGSSRTLLKDPLGLNSMALSPDGRTLATAGGTDNTVRLWDAISGKARVTLKGHTDSVNSVVFSPDSTSLATASDDTTAMVWDAASGIARAVLTGHTDVVNSAAFSPDGKILATASDDENARLWNVTLPDAEQIARDICRIVNRNFTRAEQSMYLHSQTSDPVCPDSAAYTER
ncbi:trypsin-like peptidase domain-containing protein [Streptomyces sp. NPDC093591]|uniref:nSTAND1 domain-containing NTPase n=1 Tax=Streptomyces sp. NPDC093591 TaxID=3366044 RepID=UPI0037FE180C